MSAVSGAGEIRDTELGEALGERYLSYALSTIMARSLPDVRDGLKPVHRRLLYAMQQLRLAPQGEFRKCAKIVGDTMGNFHPHGNQAIYDALARLAQDFTVRYPLIDGLDRPLRIRRRGYALSHSARLAHHALSLKGAKGCSPEAAAWASGRARAELGPVRRRCRWLRSEPV